MKLVIEVAYDKMPMVRLEATLNKRVCRSEARDSAGPVNGSCEIPRGRQIEPKNIVSFY